MREIRVTQEVEAYNFIDDKIRSESEFQEQKMKPRKERNSVPAAKTKKPQEVVDNVNEKITSESVYDFYVHQLIPAVLASLPLLASRVSSDVVTYVKLASTKLWEFVLPAWYKESELSSGDGWRLSAPHFNFTELWEQAANAGGGSDHGAMSDFMLRNFDTNGDGHISASELLNMTEIMTRLQTGAGGFPIGGGGRASETFWSWFSREWPLMDWKIGVFLWRTFGGLLVVVAVLSIVPGRLHTAAGKILRWPILALTYALISVELVVYVVIRLAIRLAESIIARPKHRSLRRKMAQAKTYEEWYQYAAALDISQKRDKWQRETNDNTSFQYNWVFIRQLINDMRDARDKNDPLLALAVLQQCTRKNVGGIMSEDLFSCTNTGEPKLIVREFADEVATTLRWVTAGATRVEEANAALRETDNARQMYEKSLERRVRNEKDKIWDIGNLIGSVINNVVNHKKHDNGDGSSTTDTTSPERTRSSMSETSHAGSETIPRDLPSFHKDHLIAFLKRARAAYGRTALCLSGGAMMGLYHFGHLVGLMETDSLPNIISGTSAGSVVGSIVCTRTDDELKRDMTPEVLGEKMKCFARPWGERIKSLWQNGCLFSFEEWMDMIKWFTCGDLTFEEAYHKTGRIFCITLSSPTKKAPPMLLNYISAPNVTIASAVIASAAVPGFIPPVRLQYKDADGVVRSHKDETYFDGSIEQDIPINGLAEMLNCQFFVACQANPHIVPFFFDARGGVGRPNRWSKGSQEASWRGGFLLAALELYLKNDMKAKFVFLRDLEAAIGFTSTMMTQEYVGSTTIVPQVKLIDFFRVCMLKLALLECMSTDAVVFVADDSDDSFVSSFFSYSLTQIQAI